MREPMSSPYQTPHSPYPARRSSPPGSPYRRPFSPPAIIAAPTALCCCLASNGGSSIQDPINKGATRNACATSAFAALGIFLTLLGYIALGAVVFSTLEGGDEGGFLVMISRDSNEEQYAVAGSRLGMREETVDELRSKTVDHLWSITESLNILYKENWTRLAADEVLMFQAAVYNSLKVDNNRGNESSRGEFKWSFDSAFLYSLTLITTIGCGSVSPRTIPGKIVTIIYTLIGIPLMLLYLSTMGDLWARYFRRFYAKICGHRPPGGGTSTGGISNSSSTTNRTGAGAEKNRVHCSCSSNSAVVRVPITLCILLITVYGCAGALLFRRIENWSLVDSSYFCFTTLTTISLGGSGGAGSYNHESNKNNNNLVDRNKVSVYACTVYVLCGLALVAMCFGLVQDEVVAALRYVGMRTMISRNIWEGTPPQSTLTISGSGGGGGSAKRHSSIVGSLGDEKCSSLNTVVDDDGDVLMIEGGGSGVGGGSS